MKVELTEIQELRDRVAELEAEREVTRRHLLVWQTGYATTVRAARAEIDRLREMRTRAVDMFVDDARSPAVREAAREVLWGPRPDNDHYDKGAGQ